jgi:hypothetical protein
VIIILIASIVRRKKAIGGWLFYFLGTEILGALVLVAQLANEKSSFIPSAWPDSRTYLAFLLASVPGVVVIAALAAVSVALLITWSWDWIERIKVLLAIDIACRLVSAGILLAFFAGRGVTATIAPVVVQGIFLSYLFMSSRVKRVFLTNDWPSPATLTDLASRLPE